MAAARKKLTGKRWALIAVAVVAAYVIYKRRKAKQANLTDPAVPFTPSPYFYTPPFGGSAGGGGGSDAGGGSGDGSSSPSGPRATDIRLRGGKVVTPSSAGPGSGPGANSGGNSQGTVMSGGGGVPIAHTRVGKAV